MSKLKRLQEIKTSKSIKIIIINWGVIILLINLNLIYFNWIIYVFSIWLIGARMNTLRDVVGHEASHFNLFRNRKLNKKLEVIYFLPFFETFNRYHKEHMSHHKYLGTDEDPTLELYTRWGLNPNGKMSIYFWYIRPVLFFDVKNIINFIFTELRFNEEYRYKMLCFWIPTSVIIFYFGIQINFFLYWIVPFFWSKPAFEFWSEVTDHYNVSNGYTRNASGYTYDLMIKPCNDRLHEVHHNHPKIPWYNLKEVGDLVSYNDSGSFHDVFKEISKENHNFFLK